MNNIQKKNAEPIKINMLGEFSMTYGANRIDDTASRSRKIWLVMEYLLVFRDREISQNELIELLWPEDDVESPSNTLKTLIYRVRAILDNLGCGSGKNMVLYRRGACYWNPALNCVIDTDLFENALSRAQSVEGEARLRLLMEAIDIYKGDFLPKTSLEPWAVPIATYYHTQYLQAVKQAILMLSSDGRYGDVISICQKASNIDPYDEELHYWLILSLYRTGERQKALQHYDYVTDMFFSRFNVNPTSLLTDLYKEIISETNNSQMDLSIIKEELKESYSPGAFYCEYAIFKDIYYLNMRTIARTGASIHLCLLSLVGSKEGKGHNKTMNKTMKKLRECIGASLRRGDVFTRYSVSQFLIMLPSASYENSVMVIERIIKAFKKQNPKGYLSVKSSIQPMTPESSEGAKPAEMPLPADDDDDDIDDDDID